VDIADVQARVRLTELVSSWNADTPAGTWLQVEMHGHTNAGAAVEVVRDGRWPPVTPTFIAPRRSSGRRPRLHFDRHVLRSDGSRWPTTSCGSRSIARRAPMRPDRCVRSCGCLRAAPTTAASTPGRLGARGHRVVGAAVFAEPAFGQYPQYDGVARRVQPTSTEMITDTGQAPTAADEAWVDPSYVDRA